TFFLRKKESMQRKTLTLRATGWRQDKGRNEGLALRAIARARQGGTFGCGQRRNGVQWKKEKIPCDGRGREERMMLKQRRLYPGDRVAMVSLSWGGLGDPQFLHKYDIAKKRLKEEFQLELVPMPHALKGNDFVARHPELRARDLMDAFRDRSIAAIFCAIGGDDTIRTLPYIDFAVMRDNPKICMGYSDTTINHLMMQRAGLVSFYGPSVMCEFGEYVLMFDYTREAVRRLLFAD